MSNDLELQLRGYPMPDGLQPPRLQSFSVRQMQRATQGRTACWQS